MTAPKSLFAQPQFLSREEAERIAHARPMAGSATSRIFACFAPHLAALMRATII
jgi:hypothetical protein